MFEAILLMLVVLFILAPVAVQRGLAWLAVLLVLAACAILSRCG